MYRRPVNKKLVVDKKKKIREKIIEVRKNTSVEKIRKWSRDIEKRFFSLREYKDAETVMFYVSYDNEVYTHDMIKKALKEGKKVVVPFSDTKHNNITPIQIKDFEELKRGAYGILEPFYQHELVVSENVIDLVVVPGVAFDTKGHRIGHGLGYYDEFLKTVTACKTGFAFEFQVLSEIPCEEHDVRMDKIVTEKRIIDCGIKC
ncbi:MAG TPA: 5-formyltetrahydrofolate cyclo-ligase [Thermoplasmatales archaeon]|nr:5-formyltetrahydrofolate cyclo-ligase [Thermoplasmatales archaeon]